MPELPGRGGRHAERPRLHDARARAACGSARRTRGRRSGCDVHGADRSLRPLPADRLLLQDVHPAALPLAALRVGPPARRRPRSDRRPGPARRSTPRKRHLHSDVAVVGGGPAGCLAALEAAALGARVVLVDDSLGSAGTSAIRSRAVDGGDATGRRRAGFEAAERLAAAGRRRGPDRASRRARRRSASTRADSSGCSQGETFVRVRREADRRRRAARPSGRRSSTATTGPGSCSRRRSCGLRHLHGVAAGGPGRSWSPTTTTGWRPPPSWWPPGSRSWRVDRPARGRLRTRIWPATCARGGTEVLRGPVPLASIGSRGAFEGLRGRRRAASGRSTADLVAMAIRPEPVIALLAQAGAQAALRRARSGEFVATALPDGVHAAGHVLGRRRRRARRARRRDRRSHGRCGGGGRAVAGGEDRRAGAPRSAASSAAVAAQHRPPPLGSRVRAEAVRLPVRGRDDQGARAGRRRGLRPTSRP